MTLENSIATIFLGNHLPEFKKWCDSKSETFFFNEAYIVSRAFKMAGTLDIDPRDIIDLNAVNSFYDTVFEKPVLNEISIEQAINKCNTELLEAINASRGLTICCSIS